MEQPIRVLLVDDSPVILLLLNDILTAAGFEVVGEVCDGKSLPKAIKRTDPDVILLDHNLPDSKGGELLKAIRRHFPHIVVLMISSDDDPNLVQQTRQHGASAFIHKPFVGHKVIHTIKHAYSQRPRRQIRAVIADDCEEMLEMLALILESMEITVVGKAENGQQAIEQVKQHQPEIVCLDLEMPVMNGLQALEQIHQHYPAMKKIMITGKSSLELVRHAIATGANHYIVKPYDPLKLHQELSRLLHIRS